MARFKSFARGSWQIVHEGRGLVRMNLSTAFQGDCLGTGG